MIWEVVGHLDVLAERGLVVEVVGDAGSHVFRPSVPRNARIDRAILIPKRKERRVIDRRPANPPRPVRPHRLHRDRHGRNEGPRPRDRGHSRAARERTSSSRAASTRRARRPRRRSAALGRRALAFPCHVARWDDIEALVDAAYEEFGRIDVLVNNAGIAPTYPDPVERDRGAVGQDDCGQPQGPVPALRPRRPTDEGRRRGVDRQRHLDRERAADARHPALRGREGRPQRADDRLRRRTRPGGAGQRRHAGTVPDRHLPELEPRGVRRARADVSATTRRAAGRDRLGRPLLREPRLELHDRRGAPRRRRRTVESCRRRLPGRLGYGGIYDGVRRDWS